MVTFRIKENASCREQGSPGCCSQTVMRAHWLDRIGTPWSDGVIPTEVGEVPRVRTALNYRDRIGTIKARWGVGRMSYRVAPGLYGVGDPGPDSPVLVSANYKLSFDRLRSVLSGRDAWILVLDTKGINVWCAAGKGTFGTDEIVRRVQMSGLERIVSHRKLVVPQLGATGVSAHVVRNRCGFRVVYGPVRAADLPAFLDAGMKAQPEMRRVRFNFVDRLVLIPVELVMGGKYALLAAAALVLLSGLTLHGYSFANVRTTGLMSAALIFVSSFGGAILGPALLPWLPGRAFSIKGAVLGFAMLGALIVSGWTALSPSAPLLRLAPWALMTPAIASFTVMNFTGASTFTSLSGVQREMRFALPAQITGSIIGLGLWVIGLLVPGGRMS